MPIKTYQEFKMTFQYINTGTNANAGNGDSIRSAFTKVNRNFEQIAAGDYTIGGGNGYTGSKGNIGYVGSSGYVGSQGIQGPAGGYTGSKGDQGDKGQGGDLGYTGSIGYTGSASSSTNWDLTSQGNGCPINVTLTTTTFDVQVPRNHLFFRDDGSWDIGSYFNTNYITGDISGGNGIALTTDRGTVFFGNSPECVPTLASHFHIMRDDPTAVDLFFGDDYNYVKLPYYSTLTNVGVEIGTDATNLWSFGKDGVLTMPDGNNGSDGRIAFNFEGYNWGNIRSHNRQVYIESGEGTTSTYSQIAVGVDIGLSSIENITLRTATTDAGDLYNDGTGHNPSFNTWTFGTDGNLTIPGDIQDANGSLIFVATTSTAPTRVNGLLWFNAEDGRAYIKYENNWVDLSPPLVPPVSTYLDGLIVDGTTISTVDSTATMYMGGDLLPEYNNLYDLGSAERQWKSLYVSTSTIYIGGTALSVDTGGNLLVDGMLIIAAANAGDRLTTGSYSVILGSDGALTLPDAGRIAIASGMLIETDRGTLALGNNMEGPGVAGHFHIAFDESNVYPPDSDLFLGDDYNYVKLPGTLGQYDYGVEINAHDRDGGNSKNWRFGTDGSMTFPDGSKQTTAYLGVDNNRWLDYMQANTEGYSYVLGVSSVQHDSQNNIVASVHHEAYGPNYTGIVKFDSAGATVWERIYSTSTSVDGWGVAVDSNDDIYVAGHVYGSGVWLSKLDSSTGENIWQTGLDGFEGYVVDVGSDDCPVIVGVDSYTNHDMFVAKFSSTGTILWQHQLGDSVYDDDAWGMAVGPSNEIIVVGTTNHDGGSGSNLLLVAKYDVSGILQWQKEIYDSNWSGWNANGADAVVDPSGNIYVLFSQDSIFGASAILIKMSPNGETVDWNLTLSAECVDQYTAALDIDTDGNVYLNSTTVDTNGVNIVYNTFVSSVSSEGSIRWQRGLRRQITDQSTSSATVVWPGAVIDTFGTTINGSSLSVKDGKIAIGGGSVNLAGGNGPNPDINTALGYILQTTTDGDVFARGEWELFNTYFDVGDTTLTVNTGTLATDTRVMNVISIDVPSGPDPDNFLTIQRLREPVERIGTGASFEYSTVQEGLFDGPGAGGVTSITGNHAQNTGVGLTSETWAQLMWVPDTSVVTINDIADGPDVYNWAYTGPEGFQIKNATTGTSHEWVFSSTGTLTLPTGGRLGAIDPKGGTMLDAGLGGNVSLTSFYSTGNYSSCVSASAGGTLYITAYNDGGPNPSRQWVFDKDGSLTLPEGGVIKNSTGTNILDGLGSGSGGFATTSTLVNGSYSVSLSSSTGILTLSTASTILGAGTDPNVYIETATTATTSTWTFGTDGVLTLPAATPVIKGGGTGTDVTVVASTGTNPATWTFAAAGGLTLPNGATIVDTTSTLVLTPNSPAQVTSLVLRSTYNSYMTADYPTDQGYQQYLHELNPVTYPNDSVSTGTEGTVISITLWDAGGLQYVQGNVEYIITGTGITAADFTPAVLTGTFAAANWTLDGGGLNYTNTNMLMIANDAIVEGEETFTVTIITTGTYAPGSGSNYLRVNIADGTTEGSESGHIHLISENMAQTSIFLGNDDKYVKVAADDQIYINVPNADTSGTSQLWTFAADGSLTFPDTTVQTTAYVASSVVNRTTGSWTLATGANTVSITVPANSNYTMWVNGNIPNGIVNWNATVNVSNTNVPVIGSQYAWYYVDGNALVLTAIPDQIIGTAGVISTSTGYVGSTANVFTFGITNNSVSTQTVYWGYTTL